MDTRVECQRQEWEGLHAVLLSVIVALFLAACGTAGNEHRSQYPAEITGIGDSPNFPLRAAGFQRGKILTYAPGMTEISNAYNLVSPEMQIASTIYHLPLAKAASPLTVQFAREKVAIEQYHAGAQLLREEEITLGKAGTTYRALRAEYSFDGEFMHRQQQLYSELIIWTHGTRYIKFRSTAPLAQRERVREKNLELLNTLNWAI
jgi:hypothetical protein